MFSKDRPFLEIDGKDVRIYPININAPLNVEFEESFPHCCEFHESVKEMIDTFVDNFPKSNLEKEVQRRLHISRKDLQYLKIRIPKQVKYTEQIIRDKINAEDWYEDITDYIEYNVYSLGSPSFGRGTYSIAVNHWVLNAKLNIEDYKREKLSLFLHQYINPSEPVETASLNKLHSIYQRWLKSFPFDLPYFSGIKHQFENRLPFLAGKARVNRYSKVATAKGHTESSFVIALLDLTKSILSKIDSVQLFEEGKISSTEQRRLELIKQERKVKNKELLEQYSQRELKYIKTIKQWLKDEKEFFLELKSIDLKEVKAKPSKRNIKNTDSSLVSFGYKTKDTTNLKKFVLELNRQVYFLKDGEKSVENFIKVLNSKDLSKEMPDIYFNCETTQLYYIFNKLKPYFNKLTFKNIEKSQLFYTKNGTLLKAQNLSASKVDLPKNYKEIDQAFTLLQ